ncbi:histidine kinase [Paracoccaceae bacterium Fryx2]|nr:histidine kinase [Paracoccaceae bacterium Fryx2]
MKTEHAPTLPPRGLSWPDWSLAAQFAVAGGVVMLLAMLVVGSVVAGRIEDAVVRNTANATALYMESFISPLSQDLAREETLSPGAQRALDEIFTNTPLGERVASYKIWKQGGLLVDASNKALVGQRFEVTENLRLAWRGDVRADFEQLGDPEDAGEKALGLPLLEIYSPIREVWSGRVIAVAEFYEVATGLKQDLARARRNSWGTVALVMVLIGASLFAIVLRGSRTIDRQLAALTELSAHNTALRLRVQNAAARSSAMNDQALRRIGADLHDGPAQLMGFAALRLDALRGAVATEGAHADLDAVETAVKDAIREIRTISRGVALPDIDQRPVPDLVQGLADAHAARSGMPVAVSCDLPEGTDLPAAVNICVYRFVQEGLNNAWHHAGGIGQEVRLRVGDGFLRLSVLDRGPGLGPGLGSGLGSGRPAGDGGLGLSGLRDRVESLGGQFEARNRTDPPDAGGAELSMVLDLRGAA